ncbi:hypothetical protein DOK78_000313 [Enterococcus sp. DIV2402]|uniref:Lipoprotein n=1 Tax=Candidatus Enterococcus lowellii TaxID=2230877 RepID=A0ABZ2SIN1_9ENTE|nr:hypothetical protein [Enterococcus sp. DIV2402]MBO0464800.1 hypothetical protein [Enterococcus sp. DIV2402]
MKKVKISILLAIVSLIVLSGCGKKDLSGVYYYEQTKPMTVSENSSEGIQVHKLEIVSSSDDKEKYKVAESAQYNPPASEGTLEIVDKNYLDMKMSKNSNELNPSDILDGIDISELEKEKFTFKNGIIEIGEVRFYEGGTKEGKKYKKVWAGSSTWREEFGK